MSCIPSKISKLPSQFRQSVVQILCSTTYMLITYITVCDMAKTVRRERNFICSTIYVVTEFLMCQIVLMGGQIYEGVACENVLNVF